jgi:hypothetical protein
VDSHDGSTCACAAQRQRARRVSLPPHAKRATAGSHLSQTRAQCVPRRAAQHAATPCGAETGRLRCGPRAAQARPRAQAYEPCAPGAAAAALAARGTTRLHDQLSPDVIPKALPDESLDAEVDPADHGCGTRPAGSLTQQRRRPPCSPALEPGPARTRVEGRKLCRCHVRPGGRTVQRTLCLIFTPSRARGPAVRSCVCAHRGGRRLPS